MNRILAAAWMLFAFADLAAAQSRLFSCPHARVLELTVTGPNSISADPIDNGKPMRMNQDPRNPLRFSNGEYSVTLSQNQGQVLLEIPDWGSATCTFGSVNVPPLIPQRGAAAPNPCGPGFHPVPETDRCDPNPRVNPNPQPQQANNVEGKFPMGGQSLGGIMRSAPSMSSARVMGLTEGSPITLLGRSGTMDGYDMTGSRSSTRAPPGTSGAASCARSSRSAASTSNASPDRKPVDHRLP